MNTTIKVLGRDEVNQIEFDVSPRGAGVGGCDVNCLIETVRARDEEISRLSAALRRFTSSLSFADMHHRPRLMKAYDEAVAVLKGAAKASRDGWQTDWSHMRDVKDHEYQDATFRTGLNFGTCFWEIKGGSGGFCSTEKEAVATVRRMIDGSEQG